MLFDKCVCGEKNATRTELIGGYIVYLCDACRNEWWEYSITHPSYREYNLVKARMKRAMNNTTEQTIDDLRCLNERDINLYVQLYYLGKKWVGKRKAEFARDDNI